jgi:hypothetical protein
VPVVLAPAGKVLLPPHPFEMPDRWIEVRDAAGKVLFSGFEQLLPVIRDEGYALLLPAGAYRVEVSGGFERKDARVYSAVSTPGTTTRLE